MTDDEVSGRLMAALPWNARRTQIQPILLSAIAALRALARLDELLFDRRTDSGALVVDVLARVKTDPTGERARFLRNVGGALWRGANHFIRVTEETLGAHLPEDENELDLESLDFEFEVPRSEIADLAESDIASALGGLDEHQIEVSLEDVAKAAVPLATALAGELRSARDKLLGAMNEGNFSLAIQVLDRTRDGLEDALFATLEAIFELHHTTLSRSTLVPGYQSALDEALELRRAIAELRLMVSRDNEALKQGGGSAHVQERIARFVSSPTFTLMRAADRMLLLGLQSKLRQRPEDGLVVEGLAKYLDSLAAINDREALVQHDRARRAEALEYLQSARSLLTVSQRGAAEQVAAAYHAAQALQGLRPDLDEQLAAWRKEPQRRLDERTARMWAEALAPLL